MFKILKNIGITASLNINWANKKRWLIGQLAALAKWGGNTLGRIGRGYISQLN
jgi:hypothetical protein